ncbi:hypothetical protein OS493_010569 [Desmophyllum pertusum]|uniref:JmjC domain-containing protein n=1 Tax=Desmophyllum pertusum TaxID=174260 RepID=A0A9W9ZQQ2_9CNID|nr:hypothetical protein OS493_010569 [Desmophyllum pertusum]
MEGILILKGCLEVPCIENIDPQTFRRKFYNQQPVVLKKSVENWKPCELWTPTYLKVALQEAFDCLDVLEAVDNKQFIDNADFASRRNISPGAFIDHVFEKEEVFISGETAENQKKDVDFRDKKKFYLRTMSMPDVLYRDIATPDQIESLKSKIYHPTDLQADSVDKFAKTVFRQDTMQLWVGTRGNVTPLHYDRNHGLLVQILGDKQVVLFSHEHTSSLYPFPSYSEKSHLSRINFRNMENEAELLASFPKFCRAEPYRCVIHTGDILYTPPFWWHDVTSQDNCISVTLPWDLEPSDEIPPCMLR